MCFLPKGFAAAYSDIGSERLAGLVLFHEERRQCASRICVHCLPCATVCPPAPSHRPVRREKTVALPNFWKQPNRWQHDLPGLSSHPGGRFLAQHQAPVPDLYPALSLGRAPAPARGGRRSSANVARALAYLVGAVPGSCSW